MTARTIVIGDIHGCLVEFDALLRVVEFQRGTDRLILCGDLVDRGPDSIGVVTRAMEIGAECVIGNHEYKYLKWRKSRAKNPQMSEKKRVVFDALSEQQWTWLESLPYYIHVDDQWTVVHAGCRAGIEVEKQVAEDLVFLRHVRRSDGKRVSDLNTPLRAETHAFWTELWTGPRSIVYGHYVERRGAMLHAGPGHDANTVDDGLSRGSRCARTLGLDTGCAFGGKLTAAIFCGDQIEIASVAATGKWAELRERD